MGPTDDATTPLYYADAAVARVATVRGEHTTLLMRVGRITGITARRGVSAGEPSRQSEKQISYETTML